MNQSEIMTLLNSDVDEKIVRNAIVAGKISTILHAADREVHRASEFSNEADWEEILKFMQGTLRKQKRERAEKY